MAQQIFPMSTPDQEPSDGEKMVLPVSQIRMVFRTSHLLFGTKKSEFNCEVRDWEILLADNDMVVIF
jgi:hypothetical protein